MQVFIIIFIIHSLIFLKFGLVYSTMRDNPINNIVVVNVLMNLLSFLKLNVLFILLVSLNKLYLIFLTLYITIERAQLKKQS